MFKRLRDELASYRAARLTAEALVWHHGVEGVRKALDEAERPHETEVERRQAVQWPSSPGGHTSSSRAGTSKRALILDVWAHRKGSLIRLFWTNGDLPLVAEWQGSVEV